MYVYVSRTSCNQGPRSTPNSFAHLKLHFTCTPTPRHSNIKTKTRGLCLSEVPLDSHPFNCPGRQDPPRGEKVVVVLATRVLDLDSDSDHALL